MVVATPATLARAPTARGPREPRNVPVCPRYVADERRLRRYGPCRERGFGPFPLSSIACWPSAPKWHSSSEPSGRAPGTCPGPWRGTGPRLECSRSSPAHRSTIGLVESWLRRANVQLVGPTDAHWQTLAGLAAGGQARGPMLMDAHLAALALEHGATLATTDRDFSRFAALRTIDPTLT